MGKLKEPLTAASYCVVLCRVSRSLKKRIIYVWLCGSSMLRGLSSSCRERGLLSGFSGELLTAAASPVEERRPQSARPSAAVVPGL